MSEAARGAASRSRKGNGWRGLGLFWVAVLALLGGGVGALQWLGPPRPPAPAAPPGSAVPASGSPARPSPASAAARSGALPDIQGRSGATTAAGGPRGGVPNPASPATASPVAPTSGPAAAPDRSSAGTADGMPSGAAALAVPHPVAAPVAALSAPSPDFPGRFLPRIGPGGRAPMVAYAASFDPSDPHPRVGLILAGVGLDRTASLAAIRGLPAAITLAVSPYADHLGPLLAAARAAGHEYLVSIPMEPHSFPLNDPGDHALLTSQTPAENRRALDWALSRFAGYVGATGALGLMRGERFAGSAEDMAPVLHRLASRGLLYVDPRPGAASLPFAWGRDVDVVIDTAADAAAIDAALDRLDRIAQRRGQALGLVGAVRPVAVAQLAAWANGLAAHGLTLAPVTALALAPLAPAATQGASHP